MNRAHIITRLLAKFPTQCEECLRSQDPVRLDCADCADIRELIAQAKEASAPIDERSRGEAMKSKTLTQQIALAETGAIEAVYALAQLTIVTGDSPSEQAIDGLRRKTAQAVGSVCELAELAHGREARRVSNSIIESAVTNAEVRP